MRHRYPICLARAGLGLGPAKLGANLGPRGRKKNNAFGALKVSSSSTSKSSAAKTPIGQDLKVGLGIPPPEKTNLLQKKQQLQAKGNQGSKSSAELDQKTQANNCSKAYFCHISYYYAVVSHTNSVK